MTLKLDSLSDWGKVELAAQTHELNAVESPAVPMQTTAQQLLFATTRAAELQARVHRLQGGANEALLWLKAGATERAKAALSRVIIDM